MGILSQMTLKSSVFATAERNANPRTAKDISKSYENYFFNDFFTIYICYQIEAFLMDLL